jgi:hypothetical protein
VSKEGEGTESLEALLGGKVLPGVVNKHNVDVESWPKDKQAETASVKKQSESAIHQKMKDPASKLPTPSTKQLDAIKSYSGSAIHQKMKDLASKLPTPSTKQLDAIKSYSGSAYGGINDALRHGSGVPTGIAADLQSYLDKAEIAEDITVYRRVSGDYSKILKSIAVEGTVFRDKGFMSTSLHPGKWHGDLTMEISVKKGARGAPISQWSHYPNEIEVLFRAGSHLKVTHFDEAAGRMKVELVK